MKSYTEAMRELKINQVYMYNLLKELKEYIEKDTLYMSDETYRQRRIKDIEIEIENFNQIEEKIMQEFKEQYPNLN